MWNRLESIDLLLKRFAYERNTHSTNSIDWNWFSDRCWFSPVNHRVRGDFLRESFIIVILRLLMKRINVVQIVGEKSQFFTDPQVYSKIVEIESLYSIMFLTQKNYSRTLPICVVFCFWKKFLILLICDASITRSCLPWKPFCHLC